MPLIEPHNSWLSLEVDDNTVITEGRVKQVYQGGGLLTMGLTSTLTAIDQADLPDYYRLGGAS